ncbi:MAG: hypothetical protein JXP34_04415, partial [Planctomycetes bacterium]|nr:hypothetical protein [Planctomycetota bacterium]
MTLRMMLVLALVAARPAISDDARPAVAIANDRLAIRFPIGAPGATLTARGIDAEDTRILLGPAARGSEPRIAGVAIVENSEEEVAADVSFERAGGQTIVL